MRHDTAHLIGSGGMGEVYRAWDADLKRHVALKYLRHADGEMAERLLREARAQARIDHPGVCEVYEVGEEDGLPFIAMEFVEGRLLDDAARDMTLEQKVLVVKRVAEAVQAAHAEGLIHRDLKPGNVIVAEDPDGELHPFVLDFGIAREQSVTGFTATGQVLGTPGYLSPEQARGENATLDRRTDVFSLGVILFELLAGVKPFRGDSEVEILLALLERDPLPFRELRAEVPRDLETVVMRCLEKDRERRYPSARALADDLGRFLAGEPVEARPVSAIGRLARRARRHPVAAGAVALAVAASLALVAVAVGGWIKYTVDLGRERDLAEARELEAKEIADFLIGIFKGADPERVRGETLTARELLDSGADRIGAEFADKPLSRARFMLVIGEIYRKLGMYEGAEELLKGAVEITEAAGPEAASSFDLAERLNSLAVLYATLGRYAEAEPLFRRVVALRSEALGPDHPDNTSGLNNLGNLLLLLGRYADAEEPYRRALEIREKHLEPEHIQIGNSAENLGILLFRLGRWDEAEALYLRAGAIKEKALGADHLSVAINLMNLADLYKAQGRLDEAEAMLRRTLEIREKSLGSDHLNVGQAHLALGKVLAAEERHDEAWQLYEQGLAVCERAVGPVHQSIADALNCLGNLRRAQGRHAEAEPYLRRAVSVWEQAVGGEHHLLAYSLENLALVVAAQGRFDEAEPYFRRALAIREASLPPGHSETVGTATLYAEMLRAVGRGAAAAALEARFASTAAPG
ncbi:MAG: tetratricopeptide repeat protein [Candidatus Sulfomarinibacteraceae bacterium]